MGTEGESGLEAPVLNASGITQPAFTPWLAPSLARPRTSPPTRRPPALDPDGGRLQEGQRRLLRQGRQGSSASPSTTRCLHRLRGRPDHRRAALKAAGIKATFNNVTVDTYNADARTATSSSCCAGATAASPRTSCTPAGWTRRWSRVPAHGDYERLNNPTCTAELATSSTATRRSPSRPPTSPDREVRREQPAGHPDRHLRRVVRVQLDPLHRLADPGQPVPDRPALGHQQRPGLRHRRVRPAAPQAGLLIT